MPDIRLVPVASPEVVTLDWLKSSTGLIDETAELVSAVTVALCSDALAGPSDKLPDPNSEDRRGWWGDDGAEEIWNGWPIGSKLWLLTRAKIVDSAAREGATVPRVEAYIRAALQPFIDQPHRVCSRIDVSATLVNSERIDARVIIYRGPKTAIQLQYQALWTELRSGIGIAAGPAVTRGGAPAPLYNDLDYTLIPNATFAASTGS